MPTGQGHACNMSLAAAICHQEQTNQSKAKSDPLNSVFHSPHSPFTWLFIIVPSSHKKPYTPYRLENCPEFTGNNKNISSFLSNGCNEATVNSGFREADFRLFA